MKDFMVIEISTNINEGIRQTLKEYCNKGWDVVSINIVTIDYKTIAYITLVKIS